MFVNVGAPWNDCQPGCRVPEEPRRGPLCAARAAGRRLEVRRCRGRSDAGDGRALRVWHAADVFAMAWHPAESRTLPGPARPGSARHLVAQVGLPPSRSRSLPPEEFQKVEYGSRFGWPYSCHDWQQGKRVLNPEYGGDGERVGRCDEYPKPLIGFPGHWAPNDLMFYAGADVPGALARAARVDRLPRPSGTASRYTCGGGLRRRLRPIDRCRADDR